MDSRFEMQFGVEEQDAPTRRATYYVDGSFRWYQDAVQCGSWKGWEDVRPIAPNGLDKYAMRESQWELMDGGE